MGILKSIFSIRNEFNGQSYIRRVINILGLKIKTKVKISKELNFQQQKEYINYVLNNQLDKSKYVDISKKPLDLKENNTKLISFYLPQFHSFPSNDDWFGRGFTEWTNAAKAMPQYAGHYQPHLPIDVGFYNLETTTIMKRQIELAKHYGIYGFSFYYYWYSGKKIMEKPIQAFLKDKSLDMPFFMFWANEDWSHLWGNGADKKILYKQEIIKGDAERFMVDILPYMKDKRYIKMDNKPMLIIYNPELYTQDIFIDFIDKIRNISKENGFEDLYIATIRKPFFEEGKYSEYLKKNHLDSIVEFIPGCVHNIFKPKYENIVNPLFRGTCMDMVEFVENKRYLYEADSTVFKGLFTNWDNTARRCYKGATIFQSTPKIYKTWLKDIMKWTKKHNKKNEQFVFINAWNEWAEGAHLEPDQIYGYAFLQATKEALEEEHV